MNNFQRVYFLGGDGNIYQTKFVSNGDNYTFKKETSNTPACTTMIRQTNKKVISKEMYQNIFKSNFSNNQNSNSIMNQKNYNGQYAVNQAETAAGGRRMFREETTSISKQPKQINITLTNTSAVNTHEFFIGDHHGLLGDKFNTGQLSYEVTATGTWGDVVLANLKQITGANPYDFHRLHISAKKVTVGTAPIAPTGGAAGVAGVVTGETESGEFFEGAGFIRLSEAGKADETAVDDEIPFTDGIDSNSFRTNIRKRPNFRFLMDGFSGIHINLPPLTRINLNTYLNAVAKVYGMRLLGDSCS